MRAARAPHLQQPAWWAKQRRYRTIACSPPSSPRPIWGCDGGLGRKGNPRKNIQRDKLKRHAKDGAVPYATIANVARQPSAAATQIVKFFEIDIVNLVVRIYLRQRR